MVSAKLTAAALAMALAVPSLAQAQSLSDVKGTVLVNRGSGFLPVAGPSSVGPGDTVMVRGGGGATLTYADGCKIPVSVGSATLIGKFSPCTLSAMTGQPLTAPTDNVGATVQDAGYFGQDQTVETTGTSSTFTFAGTTFTVATIAGGSVFMVVFGALIFVKIKDSKGGLSRISTIPIGAPKSP